MSKVLVDLPVAKMYLVRYLQNRYGSPVKFKGPLKTIFHEYLNNHTNKERSKIKKPYRFTVPVEITEDVFLRNGHFLTDTYTVRLNKEIEEEFKTRCFMEISVNMQHSAKREIKPFLEKYLDENGYGNDILELGTMIKAFYRYRLEHGGTIKKSKSTY